MAISLDSAHSPAALADSGTGTMVNASSGGTWVTQPLTTAAFTPAAGTMVVVLAGIGFSSSAGSLTTCTVQDSLANSYTAAQTSGADADFDYAGCFYKYYAASPGSITVKGTRNHTGAGAYIFTTLCLLGTSGSVGTNFFSPITGSGTVVKSSITRTTTGSWVLFVLGTYNDGAFSGQLANTVIYASKDNTSAGDWAIAGGQGSGSTLGPSDATGAATFGWSAFPSTPFAWAGMEVLPAAVGAAVLPDLVMAPRIAP